MIDIVKFINKKCSIEREPELHRARMWQVEKASDFIFFPPFDRGGNLIAKCQLGN